MPYTTKQQKFFNAVEHGMKPRTGNLKPQTAAKMAAEARTMPTKPPVSKIKKAGGIAALRNAVAMQKKMMGG